MVVGGICRIGVLGGIGPEATSEFYNKLIQKIQKKKLIRTNKDFPQIIINSIPASELIYEEILNKQLEPYLDGLKELDRFGVDFIVMVCNTIHIYYDQLQKEINTPILDLRKELRKTLRRKGIKSVFIIGTPATINTGLYRFRDIKFFEPNEKEINQLSHAIFNFNKGINKQKEVQRVRRIVKKYLHKKSATVVCGCTEFAVMLDKEKFPKINTIDVLVESTVKAFLAYFNRAK